MKNNIELFENLVRANKAKVISKRFMYAFTLLTLTGLVSIIVKPSIEVFITTLLASTMIVKMILSYYNYCQEAKILKSKVSIIIQGN